VDQQADLYAVGSLLLQLLNHQKDAHEGDAMVNRVRAVATRALRLDPNERWSSAAEFASELTQAAGIRLPPLEALAVYTRDQGAGRNSGRPTPNPPRPKSDSGRLKPAGPPLKADSAPPRPTAAITPDFPLPPEPPRREPPPDINVTDYEGDRPMAMFDSSIGASLVPSVSIHPTAKRRSKALWLSLTVVVLLGGGVSLWRLASHADAPPLVSEERSAACWSFVTVKTGDDTKLARESTLPSCRNPKPVRFSLSDISRPTFSYRLRSCGVLIEMLVEPSWEMSWWWRSPFGPGGIGT
jgi:hypothetical protein